MVSLASLYIRERERERERISQKLAQPSSIEVDVGHSLIFKFCNYSIFM